MQLRATPSRQFRTPQKTTTSTSTTPSRTKPKAGHGSSNETENAKWEMDAPSYYDFHDENEKTNDMWFGKALSLTHLPKIQIKRDDEELIQKQQIETKSTQVTTSKRDSLHESLEDLTIEVDKISLPTDKENIFQAANTIQFTNEYMDFLQESNEPESLTSYGSPSRKQLDKLIASTISVKTPAANKPREPMHNRSTQKSTSKPKAPAPLVKKSVKALTVPMEFNFSTRSRTDSNFASTVSAPPKLKPKKTAELTEPKPFSFQTAIRRSSEPSKASPFVSLAVKVKKFENQTPDRFKRTATQPYRSRFDHHNPTKAETPNLLRRKIASHKIASTEERQLAEIKAHSFRARPLNRSVLNSSGDIGMPRPKKVELTIPYSPPITKPKHTVPAGTPLKQSTVRAHPFHRTSTPEVSLPHRRLELPNFQLPGEVLAEQRKIERDLKAKQEKAADEALNSKGFKAAPLREHSYHEPAIPRRQPTIPVTPKLATKERARYAAQAEASQREYELELETENRQFYANEMPDFEGPGGYFEPRKSEKPLTQVESPQLATKYRSVDRHEFDMTIKDKMMREEARRKEQKASQEARELAAAASLRKKLVPKANPLPPPRGPFHVRASTRELTVPESPLITKRRTVTNENRWR